MNLFHLFLKKLAGFQVKYPYLSLLLLAFLTVAIYSGVSKVRTVASLEQMMPKDIEEIRAFNTLRDNHLGQDMIAIIIEIDPNSPDPDAITSLKDKRVYDYINYVEERLLQEPDVLQAYSYPDVLKSFGVGYDEINDPAVQDYLRSYINDDSSVTMIIITTDVSANDPRMNLLSTKIKQHIESAGHPPGTKIRFTGTPVIQQRLGELITRDRADTQWIATIMVFLLTMILFGTFTSALVPIAIVTISVNWLYGTMGYNNLPISTLAGGVAAMVIGIGIDFAIHIMNKFKYERKKGHTIEKSIEEAVVETGTALTATSMTTIAAFLAFLVGAMPEMGRFGILMAIGIGYSLLFSLFGLPALLIAEEHLIYFIREKLRFGVEGEFKLKKDKEC